jgi:hypothetical protein
MSESILAKRLVNVLFLGVVATAVAIYIFRAELADAVSDSVHTNSAAMRRAWSPGDGGKFVLRPERNDPTFLRVGALHPGRASSIGVPVNFDLTNLGDANDFPNIAVVMTGSGGRQLRQILFSPQDYPHGDRFEKEQIQLILQPRPDERGFTVRVFYGERP